MKQAVERAGESGEWGGGNSVGATTYISNSSCCSCCWLAGWLAGVTTSTDSGAQCAIIHYQQLGILKCSKAAETTQEANKNTAKKATTTKESEHREKVRGGEGNKNSLDSGRSHKKRNERGEQNVALF